MKRVDIDSHNYKFRISLQYVVPGVVVVHGPRSRVETDKTGLLVAEELTRRRT